MHTYRKARDGICWLYTVGFESASGNFETMDDFSDEQEARDLVHYLNGGDKSK